MKNLLPFFIGQWIRAGRCPVLALCLIGGVGGAVRAEEFGDISVSPNAIYTGNTFHGYAETRVVLENRSGTKPHVVTLVYPNNDSYGSYGNCISRLSRTVPLPAGAREVVSLLQPPLPLRGDGTIRVEVDGHHEGEVRAPNVNSHCNTYSRGGGLTETVLVSRSLDFDGVTHLFNASGGRSAGAFTAAKAVGPPDLSGGTQQASCWMPDMRSRGRGQWLELDYATPQVADKVVVCTPAPLADADLILLGATGTNLARISLASARMTFSRGQQWEVTLPTNAVPVKTVRLEFNGRAPGAVFIDAVQLSGPGGAQWASAARASSDNSAMASRFSFGGGPTAEVAETIRAESPVADWSDNWLAYSAFDAIVLGEADLAGLPAPVFTALGGYVQAGGNLMLLGRSRVPPQWHAARTTPMAGGTRYEIGFGNIFVLGSGDPAAVDSSAAQRLREAARDSSRYFQSLPGDSGAANSVMPVVENIKIPVRGVVVVMLAFVVIIGPVNMIYLSRIKRRTWMLWTIPAISFATTLLVFAYSLLREGITPDTRVRGLTVLDQVSHQAATIGGEAFYCPLTPGGGLRFELSTEATPLVNVSFGSGTPREVDWTQSQHLQRGWVAARVPEHFHLRKAETRRERIQVVNENGKLQIVNSLGAPIKSLWYADANLNLYQAARVGAGDRGGLIPASQTAPADHSGAGGLLRDLGFAGRGDSLGADAGKYLYPNSYIAVLESNPFLENGLAGSGGKRTQSSAVVFGLLEAPEIANGNP